MKVKIKSFNGELPCFFTEGKHYVVDNVDPHGGWVYADDGEDHYILINECAYLNGGSWEVVE